MPLIPLLIQPALVAGTFILGSTNDPYLGTKSIEASLVITGDNVTLTSASFDISDFSAFVFRIKSKATWLAPAKLRFAWFKSSVLQGSWVTMGQDDYGFDSTNTDGYQHIEIPMKDFALAGVTDIDHLQLEPIGNGAGIGFFLDNIELTLPPAPAPLRLPQLTTVERNLLELPPGSIMMIYNTTTGTVQIHDGTSWSDV